MAFTGPLNKALSGNTTIQPKEPTVTDKDVYINPAIRDDIKQAVKKIDDKSKQIFTEAYRSFTKNKIELFKEIPVVYFC